MMLAVPDEFPAESAQITGHRATQAQFTKFCDGISQPRVALQRGRHGATERFLSSFLCSIDQWATSHAARRLRQYAGSASISDIRRHASGLGGRSSCSHDRTVDGSTSRNAANAAWLIAIIPRTRRTSAPPY